MRCRFELLEKVEGRGAELRRLRDERPSLIQVPLWPSPLAGPLLFGDGGVASPCFAKSSKGGLGFSATGAGFTNVQSSALEGLVAWDAGSLVAMEPISGSQVTF
ncbi:hypothetical protein L7F22_030269, partial [Adiantum nelumboides]|nr:hypothetical protein [Adiantum nelumboides]